MNRTALHVCLALLLAILPMDSGAQIQLPQPTGFINDIANVISPEAKAEIQRVIDEVRQKSGGEIAVVTLPSLEGRTRDEVALQILREWGVGRSGQAGDRARNSGVVVLVVPKETSPTGSGELKIELGYGTNTFITAAEAGAIRDQYMIPAFQRQPPDYGAGIRDGVRAIAQEFAENFDFELTGDPVVQPQPQRQRGRGAPGSMFIWITIIIVIMAISRGGRGGGGGRRGRGGNNLIWLLPWILSSGRGRGSGGWSGGGFGGGFG
ncbi:MAG: TPM domain-containing protein, partial [Gemmatimonadota bacterium]